MKLGSLFDGSGTAPLCAMELGWEPVWASEIEPYPIAVTKTHFPNMKHLGDITKINGAEIEPVDVIVGGSPCQNLSVAGNREGLKGSESSLFYEMIRVIKEMRRATNGRYPRWVLWENVPGSFSSNSGRDYYEVIKGFASVASDANAIPEPPRRGGTDKLVWRNAGAIMGSDYSIAWRVLDAEYFGVPQRRRRVFLVADYGRGPAGADKNAAEGRSGGQSAAKVLFKPTSRAWDTDESRAQGKETPADAVGSADRDG